MIEPTKESILAYVEANWLKCEYCHVLSPEQCLERLRNGRLMCNTCRSQMKAMSAEQGWITIGNQRTAFVRYD